jgi:hypothetical protein
MATEYLSELLEKPLEREKIDTAKGLLENRWSFFVDLK